VGRPHRDKYGGTFHVWSHSVWTTDLFRDDLDRSRFISELARTTERVGWRCIGFCLLTNHDHLIVEVEDNVLPAGMQELNHRYAVGFNARHRLRGHVFGARFGSRRIKTNEDLEGAYRYVMRNPIEAGLCDSPERWPWSCYRGTVGLGEPFTFVDPSPVLACFSANPAVAIAGLRRYVEGGDEYVLRRYAPW